MQPSLMEGDVVWVSKWQIRHHIPYPAISFTSGDSFHFNFSWKEYRFQFPGENISRNDNVVFDRPHIGNNITSIKRVAALPGETIKIRNRKVFINGEASQRPYSLKLRYRVNFKSADSRSRILPSIPNADPVRLTKGPFYAITLTDSVYVKLGQDTGVIFIRPMFELPAKSDEAVWPHWKKYGWNLDNFGPVYIPKKGDSLKIDNDFFDQYAVLIAKEEQNFISPFSKGKFLVNGKKKAYYTFTKNYFFLLGDNRHDALDSRFYGPVNTDLIAGKANRILFGTFADQKGINAINKNRFWRPL